MHVLLLLLQQKSPKMVHHGRKYVEGGKANAVQHSRYLLYSTHLLRPHVLPGDRAL